MERLCGLRASKTVCTSSTTPFARVRDAFAKSPPATSPGEYYRRYNCLRKWYLENFDQFLMQFHNCSYHIRNALHLCNAQNGRQMRVQYTHRMGSA